MDYGCWIMDAPTSNRCWILDYGLWMLQLTTPNFKYFKYFKYSKYSYIKCDKNGYLSTGCLELVKFRLIMANSMMKALIHCTHESLCSFIK